MISECAADVAIPDLPLPVLYHHDDGGEKHEPVSLHAATSPRGHFSSLSLSPVQQL
jgi:hypothetical protein